jgi:2-keto-4-pentenoate hydratase/2-oxohepta-3-ene-1,7-dioic acid hydratase in catechol pathway
MKFASYRYQDTISCGIVAEQGIIDIPSHPQNTLKLSSVLEIIQKSPESLERLKTIAQKPKALLGLNQVELLAPILTPGKLLALACNYPQHLAEYAKPADQTTNPRHTTTPWPFLMPANVLTAANTTIPWPCYSKQLDYEVELAVVIGKKCKEASAKQAKDYIFGYTIANDISARSVTFKNERVNRPRDDFYDWLVGKWADGFLPVGPWIVSADQIPDPRNLALELKVNGRTRQKSNTGQMTYSVYEIVAFLSHLMTLEPGDIICTGTPHGTGHATGKYLQPGDKMDCTIDYVGTLTNTLGRPPKEFYEPLKTGTF